MFQMKNATKMFTNETNMRAKLEVFGAKFNNCG